MIQSNCTDKQISESLIDELITLSDEDLKMFAKMKMKPCEFIINAHFEKGIDIKKCLEEWTKEHGLT